MTMSSDSRTRELVEQLLFRYAAIIDDGDLVEWPDLFVEEGIYRLTSKQNHQRGLPACLIYCKGRGMMRDRVTAIRHALTWSPHTYRHHYSNLVVEPGASSEEPVGLRANYLLFKTQEEGDSTLLATGRLIASIRLSGPARFLSKTVLYDACRIPGNLVLPI
jgi:anthranilate 1,2-dioxygenase small subunit